MNISNIENLFYQFPIAAILSSLLIYKFSLNVFHDKLIKQIFHGIKIGLLSSIIVPILIGLNTIFSDDSGNFINLLQKNLILHFFIFSMFVFIGMISGISISVFLYNKRKEEGLNEKRKKTLGRRSNPSTQ